MATGVTLLLGNQEPPKAAKGKLRDALGGPVVGEKAHRAGHRYVCDWCAAPITLHQTETAILQGGELWGYVHEGCVDAVRAHPR